MSKWLVFSILIAIKLVLSCTALVLLTVSFDAARILITISILLWPFVIYVLCKPDHWRFEWRKVDGV